MNDTTLAPVAALDHQLAERKAQVPVAAPIPANELTAAELRDRVNLIQQVMRSVMKPETHYGVIPGTQKPTLYKAGSEVLLSTFRVAVVPRVEDLSTDDTVRYRVYLEGRHQVTGALLGTGIGECSSAEDKYAWRRTTCDQEFQATDEAKRRKVWKRGKGKSVHCIDQVHTNPSDVANTVLKMAKKRAQIDFTLTALAASDIFTQDIEDVPEEIRETLAEESRGAPAPSKTERTRDEINTRTAPEDGGITAAEVRTAIDQARSFDALNDAGDLIREVADPKARADLRKAQNAKAREIRDGGGA